MAPDDLLTWGMLAFMGTGTLGVVVGTWKVFSIRKADHEQITEAIEKAKKDLENKIDRLDREYDEKYQVLHGRVNKGGDDLREVGDDVAYQRGVTDTLAKLKGT